MASNSANIVSVPSVAALQALGAASAIYPHVNVVGWHEGTDYGGGMFDWNAASTATANGGTILAAIGVATGRWLRRRQGIQATPVNFGARQDAVQFTASVTCTTGSPTVAFSSGRFAASDIGKPISIGGIGVAGAIKLATIAAVNSATSIDLDTNPGTARTAVSEPIIYGTDDTAAIQAALNYAAVTNLLTAASGQNIFAVTTDGPGGLVSGDLTISTIDYANNSFLSGLTVRGDGGGSAPIYYKGTANQFARASLSGPTEFPVWFRDLWLICMTDGTAGKTALAMDGMDGSILDCVIKGFYDQVTLNVSTGPSDTIRIRGNNFVFPGNRCIHIGNSADDNATGTIITENLFIGGTIGIDIDNSIANPAIIGTQIYGNDFESCVLGINANGYNTYIGPNNFDATCTTAFQVGVTGPELRTLIVGGKAAGGAPIGTINSTSAVFVNPDADNTGIVVTAANTPKAWGFFVPGSLPTVENSANITSITRSSTGVFVITFNVDMANTSYAVVVSPTYTAPLSWEFSSKGVGVITVTFKDGTGTVQDPTNVSFAVYDY